MLVPDVVLLPPPPHAASSIDIDIAIVKQVEYIIVTGFKVFSRVNAYSVELDSQESKAGCGVVG
jgi:hypothetical protein